MSDEECAFCHDLPCSCEPEQVPQDLKRSHAVIDLIDEDDVEEDDFAGCWAQGHWTSQ